MQQNKNRRPWTPQQDEALIYLRDNLKLRKWPEVAKKMFSMFRLEGRSEKQCRDRYKNFLSNMDQRHEWTLEDEKKMTKLYYQIGNKWSEISNSFPNINGVYIKNKFYSRLRKAIRHINLIIHSTFFGTYQPFSFQVIFQLVNAATNKETFTEYSELKTLYNSNPNFIEDFILKILEATDVGCGSVIKKKCMSHLELKEETKWKKIIEFLMFLEKEASPENNQDEENSEKRSPKNNGATSKSNSKHFEKYCKKHEGTERINEAEKFYLISDYYNRGTKSAYSQIQSVLASRGPFYQIKPISILCDMNQAVISDEKVVRSSGQATMKQKTQDTIKITDMLNEINKTKKFCGFKTVFGSSGEEAHTSDKEQERNSEKNVDQKLQAAENALNSAIQNENPFSVILLQKDGQKESKKEDYSSHLNNRLGQILYTSY